MSKFIKYFFPRRQHLEIPLVGLLLLLSVNDTEAKTTINQLKKSPTHQVVFGTKSVNDSSAIVKGKLPNKDGVYLYGQSPEPNQIGQEYMVFEVSKSNVTGAFYLPQSEFNCFQGSLSSGKLAVMVANSAGSEPYADPIADQNSPQIAAAGSSIRDGYEQIASPYAVGLQNYYQLSSVSANDQQILATCKNNYR